MHVAEAIRGRHSTRAFLDQPVAHETLNELLDIARWAPSGVNTQPWHVAVVQGETKARLSAALLGAREAGQTPNPDYSYYPDEWAEPFKGRRVACGKALYSALQIERHDKERQKTAWENNYRFFGAPVGLLFFIDKRLNKGSWLDMGMFLQSVMLAARGLGLATCPQASLAEFPDIVRGLLGMPAQLAVVCGMSVGYEDTAHPVNQYRLEREAVEAFTRWYD